MKQSISDRSQSNDFIVCYPHPLTIEINNRLEENISDDTTTITSFADIIYKFFGDRLANRKRKTSSRSSKRSTE